MTEIQEQYTEFAKRGQEAAFSVVDAWAKSIQEATSALPSVATQEGASQVVDQIFDFTATLIDVQRNLVKQFITTSVSITEDVTKNLTERANA
jgi:hypothetical protein